MIYKFSSRVLENTGTKYVNLIKYVKKLIFNKVAG